MIKVIGKDPSSVKMATCKNCASILEYTEGDTEKIKHSFDYTGDYEISKGIRCPACGQPVLVK